MLGSIEYSVEYIRLYNLMSRCKRCRQSRRYAINGVRKQVFTRNGKVVIRRYRTGDALPCIYSCPYITAYDIDYYDLMRFEELRDAYEPIVVDYEEDNARMNACVETDENGGWMKIELTSLV